MDYFGAFIPGMEPVRGATIRKKSGYSFLLIPEIIGHGTPHASDLIRRLKCIFFLLVDSSGAISLHSTALGYPADWFPAEICLNLTLRIWRFRVEGS